MLQKAMRECPLHSAEEGDIPLDMPERMRQSMLKKATREYESNQSVKVCRKEECHRG